MFKSLTIFKNQKLRKNIVSIAIPIAMQNLITFLAGLMDTLMLGQVGEVELSAATIANQYSMLLMGLSFGIASGTNVLLAQYWGKQDKKSMHSILAIAYHLTVIVAAIFFIPALFFPELVMKIFTNDIDVIANGAVFLRYVSFSYIATALSNVILMTLRSVGTVKISIYVYLNSLVMNTFLNWVFIFGHLGSQPLGVKGAAIATTITRIFEFLLSVTFMFGGFEKRLQLKIRHLYKFDISFFKDMSKVVLPVILNEFLWSAGNSGLMMVMGRMSRAFVTATSITNVTVQLAQIITIGISNACAIMIGNIIGEEKYDYAKEFANGMFVLSIFLGILSGLVIFAIRPIVLALYNITPETYEIAMAVLGSAAIVVFCQTQAIMHMMGILRGGGDIHFVLICDIIFLWLCALPLGAIAGLYFKLPPHIVFLILKCDELLKIIFSTFRIKSGSWVKNLTRT